MNQADFFLQGSKAVLVVYDLVCAVETPGSAHLRLHDGLYTRGRAAIALHGALNLQGLGAVYDQDFIRQILVARAFKIKGNH